MFKKIIILLSSVVILQAGSDATNPAFSNSFFQIGNNPARYALENTGGIHGSIQSVGSNFNYDVLLDIDNLATLRYVKDSVDNFIISSGIPIFHDLFVGADYNYNTKIYSAGMIFAPSRYLSFGAKLNNIENPDFVNLGIGIRPFTHRVTLGYSVNSPLDSDFKMTESNSCYYVETELVDGLLLGGNYNDETEELTFSAGVNFSNMNIMYNKNENSETASMSIYTKLLNKISFPTTYHRLMLKGEYHKENYGFLVSGNNFNELILSLEKFKKSKRANGLVIDAQKFSMGFSELLELYEALLDIRKSGKKIYLYSINGNNATFLLGSAVTKHITYEDGIYNIKGFGTVTIYTKDLLDSLGINMNVERVGKYKSAVEQFIRNDMSDEAREQLSIYLENMKKLFVNAVSKGRRIPKEKVKEIIHNGPYTMRDAKKKSLVNGFVYPDEVTKYIKKREKIKKLKYRNLAEFNYEKSFLYDWKNPKVNNKIAVIYASGQIVEGKSKISPFGG
ncbi:MAG: S49 family peptidase, partial [Candidatus Marinimicrobia bacterium]|nr:S49 family peptidase [Candidatus Neomarinimicrobiota bacterium]